MFGKSSEEKEHRKLKELATQIQFYEYLCNYTILVGSSGSVPITLYIMIDYTAIKIMTLLDVPESQLTTLKELYRVDHDKMLGKLTKGEQLEAQSFDEKVKDQQAELKKLGVNFKLDMPTTENKPIEKKSNGTTLPPLTKEQIKKIIEQNFDEVIDFYLRKKKKEEEDKKKKDEPT